MLKKDLSMLEEYMQTVKEEAIQKLNNLELAAIYENFEDFQIRYIEFIQEKYFNNTIE